MTFAVDRDRVTEGDVVVLSWDCPGAEHVKLTIDNGFKATTLDVAANDSKKFRLNRTKGKTKLTLSAVCGGKVHSRSLSVRVKKMKPVKAYAVDDRGNRVKPLVKVRQWWQQSTAKLRYSWQSFSEKKQFAYKVLGLLMVVSLLGSVAPKLSGIGMLLLVVYLLWTVMKR